MQKKLLDLIKLKVNHSEKELKQICSSCCPNVSFRVIDFDLVKDKFSETLLIKACDRLNSVDAIMFKTDELYLIEMKKYDSTGSLKLDDFIKNRILKFHKKIVDTVFILLGLIGYYDMDKDFYTYFLNPSKLKIKPILLCNFSSQDFTKADIILLPFKNISITNRIDSNILFMTCEMFSNKFK